MTIAVRNAFRSAYILEFEVADPDGVGAVEHTVGRIFLRLRRVEYIVVRLVNAIYDIAVEVVEGLSDFGNAGAH